MFTAACLPAVAQTEKLITLSEAIALARTQSVDAAVVLNKLKTSYWEYRTFKADLLPEVNLTGTLPSYKKSYSTYQQSLATTFTYVEGRSVNLALSARF